MIGAILHAGTEHPNLAWVIIPSMLTFLAGIGIGHYSEQIGAFLRPGRSAEETN